MRADEQQELNTLDDIRNYVQETLCSRDNLQPGCFAISERPFTSRGQVCAIHFCLHGPRLIRLTAIWDTQNNTILFYGSQGERFHKTRLATSIATAA